MVSFNGELGFTGTGLGILDTVDMEVEEIEIVSRLESVETGSSMSFIMLLLGERRSSGGEPLHNPDSHGPQVLHLGPELLP